MTILSCATNELENTANSKEKKKPDSKFSIKTHKYYYKLLNPWTFNPELGFSSIVISNYTQTYKQFSLKGPPCGSLKTITALPPELLLFPIVDS